MLKFLFEVMLLTLLFEHRQEVWKVLCWLFHMFEKLHNYFFTNVSE